MYSDQHSKSSIWTSSKMALLTMLLLSLTVNSAFSARIAAFCTIGKSQYMNLRGILEELASRGHEVTMVIPSTEKVQLSDRVQHKIFKIPYEPGFMENELLKLELEGDKFRLLSKMMEVLSTVCESVLNDTKIMEELRGYDLLVYDVLGVCGALIGDRLGVRRVQILVTPNNPFDHMIPTPLSYIPMMVLPGFTDKMTFLQRVTNLVAYIGLGLFKDLLFARSMNALKHKYNITTERSYQETVDGVELVLIRADFAIEYAQPLLPGNVMVGPLNVKDGKPLPPDLEEFVNDSGGHGFIIVSFGSNLASILPRTVVDMLATAFGKLKQRVVWRLKGYIPSFLGSNIKVVEWLPQNDLLAYKNIKAFVSHVGHDSLYESAYHGVPLVAFPQFADQHFNAKKAENLGIGLAVDPKGCNAQELFDTIQRVISEPRFKTKVLHVSSLLKDRRRTPLEETGDWLEYVIRHGGAQHLRAQVFNMPWYQHYLLDVMAFLVAIVTLIIVAIWFACRCCRRLCCKLTESRPKKE